MTMIVPRLSPSLACPYCYEMFTAGQIMFRCTGRLSRDGRKCDLRPDPVLSARMGNEAQMGPAFRPTGLAKGRTSKARCPHCLGESFERICPYCHSRLPVQFGMVDSKLFAMAGAKDSGKTVYMTVLVHELKSRVGERFNAALMDADEETRRLFGNAYEAQLYERGQMFATTRRAAQNDGRVPPLVFRFSAQSRGLVGDKVDQMMLSFFDTAGEDFLTDASVEVNTRYLACASGIMLLLDPLQMAGARRLAIPGAPLPGTGPLYENPATILTRVHELLLKRQQGRRAKIDMPIAVVFTKIDALWHTFKDSSPLRAAPQHGGAFDTADSLDVHEQIRHLLREWDGAQIEQILATNYSRYRYFGVSALGNPPTADLKVPKTGIQPYRVADPLLWLLSEAGAVPRTRESR